MEKITFKHFKLNLIAQPFFVWHSLDTIDKEDEENDFWDHDFEVVETSESEIIAKTFHKIENAAVELLIKQGAIVFSGNDENKIAETKKYFGTNKIIINPVFEYNGALAKPLAYDFGNNFIIDVKFSKKTKRMDFLKAYYEHEIITKNNLIVNDYWLYLPEDIKGKKGQINLTRVNYINVTKGGDVYDAEDKDGNLKAKPFKELIVSLPFPLKDINLYIQEIEAAQFVKTYDKNLVHDSTEFGDNPFWDELLEKMKHPYAGMSGFIVSKKAIVNDEVKSSPVLELYNKLQSAQITDASLVDKDLNRITKAERIIWYDFEGFSLPYPAVDDTKPYQQIVFQLSKIETNGEVEELSKDNLIWDPLYIDAQQLFAIMQAVYADAANLYIVYNKGYENTRLKEIANLLIGTEHYDEALKMFEHIDANTLDLWDLFKISNGGKNIPPIMMHDQKCKTSIKNIEKHISKNKIDVGFKIKEYKQLDVQNGAQAMSHAIRRATGIMGDNEWKQWTDGLKTYCENDVRMMLLVYFFIKSLQK